MGTKISDISARQTANNTQSQLAHSVRYRQLDFLRGLMLIIMTADHLDSVLKPITYETFGFVTAASGFVFLSGLVSGIVFTRYTIKHGIPKVRKKFFNRALDIYKYQICLLLIALVLLLGSGAIKEFWYSNLDLLIDAPFKGFLLGGLLLYQPTLLDILPLYCLFLLLSPLVFTQIFKGNALWVFLISLLFWGLSQKGFREIFFNLFVQGRDFKPSHFNFFAWQFLFFSGMILGYFQIYKRNLVDNFLHHRGLFIVSLLLCIVFFVVKHTGLEPGFININHFNGKSNLGPLRLLNFLVLSHVIAFLLNRFKNAGKFSPVELLGRHSLQVYSFHVVLILIALPFLNNLASFAPWEVAVRWEFFLLVVVNLLAVMLLLIPARLHAYLKK